MNYALATTAHDPELRQLARLQAMPGWVRLAFAHEPDWAGSLHVFGHHAQTLVALDDAGRVAGCGVRAVRRVFINGRPSDMGYLCGLRLLPRVRSSLVLARGYRFLRTLHDGDHLTSAYLTTIVEGNVEAMRVLTSRRSSLPAYLDCGRFVTGAIPLGPRRSVPRLPAGVVIRRGDDVPLDLILRYLAEEGPKRQFFPVLRRDDLGAPQWRGLDPSDFRVALRGDTIIGAVASWDQSAFRQTVVDGYAPTVRMVRPLINAALRITSRRPLPPSGCCLSHVHAVLACVTNDDLIVFAALLERLCADYRRSPYDYVVVGLHERDPLREALAGFRALEYASRLYCVFWEDGRSFCETLTPHLIPHLETAAL